MKAQKANTKKKSVPEKKHAQIGFGKIGTITEAQLLLLKISAWTKPNNSHLPIHNGEHGNYSN